MAGICIWGCDVDDEEPEDEEEPVEDSEEPEEEGEDNQTDLELCEAGDEAACARVNQEDASYCPPELAGCNDGEEIEIPAEIVAELGADPCIDPGAAPGVNPCLVNPGEEGGDEPADPDEVADLVPDSPCGPPDAGIAAPINRGEDDFSDINCDEALPENFNDPNQGAVDPKQPDDDNPLTPVSGGTTPGETGGGDPVPAIDSDDKGAAGNADEVSEQGSDESESAAASDTSGSAPNTDNQGASTSSESTATDSGQTTTDDGSVGSTDTTTSQTTTDDGSVGSTDTTTSQMTTDTGTDGSTDTTTSQTTTDNGNGGSTETTENQTTTNNGSGGSTETTESQTTTDNGNDGSGEKGTFGDVGVATSMVNEDRPLSLNGGEPDRSRWPRPEVVGGLMLAWLIGIAAAVVGGLLLLRYSFWAKTS